MIEKCTGRLRLSLTTCGVFLICSKQELFKNELISPERGSYSSKALNLDPWCISRASFSKCSHETWNLRLVFLVGSPEEVRSRFTAMNLVRSSRAWRLFPSVCMTPSRVRKIADFHKLLKAKVATKLRIRPPQKAYVTLILILKIRFSVANGRHITR